MPLPSVKRLILNTARGGKPVVIAAAQALNHIAEGIHVLSVAYDFIMKVGCYRASRIAHGGDGLSFRDLLALLYFHFVKVSITGYQATAVTNFTVRPVACLKPALTNEGHATGCGSHDHSSTGCGKVDTGVFVFPFVKRIDSGSESGDNEVEVGVYDGLQCGHVTQPFAVGSYAAKALAKSTVHSG